MTSIAERFSLTSQVAVVTGAGRGIGEGIALDFADAGAKVALAARRTEEIERVAAQIVAAGGEAIAVTTDVMDPEHDSLSAIAGAGYVRAHLLRPQRAVEVDPLVDLVVEEAGRAVGGAGVIVGALDGNRHDGHPAHMLSL